MGYNIQFSSLGESFKTGFSAGATEPLKMVAQYNIPGVSTACGVVYRHMTKGHAAAEQDLEMANSEKVDRTARVALNDLEIPSRAGVLGACGGMIGGAVAGAYVATIVVSGVWGSGVGCLEEGEAYDNEAAMKAGRIMTKYVAPIITIVGAGIGMCAGCCFGAAAGD